VEREAVFSSNKSLNEIALIAVRQKWHTMVTDRPK